MTIGDISKAQDFLQEVTYLLDKQHKQLEELLEKVEKYRQFILDEIEAERDAEPAKV